ncbi:DUF4391 domain-containing protein [Aeromicrobium piscarium]|uniref:DUF4391 domain-containing protein n=1 Tax=Aeromicrobium piscarium TaxID=2590901 RepID=A0A554RMD3_9ACTN|nr:DUF4391 domain-containing protein [Aeromicrobium piscarium]
MVEPVETHLYRWPPAAKYGRVIPKVKFYEQATLGATVKDKFVSDVCRITWAYKLAESTINLSVSAEVPEIQPHCPAPWRRRRIARLPRPSGTTLTGH